MQHNAAKLIQNRWPNMEKIKLIQYMNEDSQHIQKNSSYAEIYKYTNYHDTIDWPNESTQNIFYTWY